jgi:enoyl-CoA hydratase
VEEDDILFGCHRGVATVTLNRPRALNAFSLDMYRRFDSMLRSWAEEPAVRAVVICGAGGQAFCAGGDTRVIYEAGHGISGDPGLTSAFFREEYELIHHIHRYPKPYIAIIDGITMGVGVGVSVKPPRIYAAVSCF